MGKPQSPEAPDPKETSQAQTGTSISTALANTMMGNVSQYGPDGSSMVYDQTGTYSFTDPYTGQAYDLPEFSATTTLSPESQAIFDTNRQTQGNLAQIGADQSAFLGDYLSEPFSYGPGEHEKWAGDLYQNINGGRVDADRQAREAQLANQGVMPGSEAYDRAMSSLFEGQQTAADRFMLDSYGQGRMSALSDRNQPINEISALLSGSQVSMPQYAMNQPSGIPTTDNAGLINNAYQQEFNNYQQQMQQWNSTMGGLFGLGAALISDRRLKKNVAEIGARFGLPTYEYHYLWDADDAPKRRGFMAQDVAQVFPEAVTHVSGFMALDYSKLPEVA